MIRLISKILLVIFMVGSLISCENKGQQAKVIEVSNQLIKAKESGFSKGAEKKTITINKDYQLVAPKVSKVLTFCGEAVPVDQPFIYEKIDRELLVNMYWQSQTFLFIKRANKWFPIIEPILKKNNIPDDFKYLAVIESGLMNVVSPSGAKGFWQFMPKTAKGYGLEVNGFVDERYQLEMATEAACNYLNTAYKKFNSWTLAAASYNMGKAGLERRLKEQDVDSYYDLLLNLETGRYVYRILAVKEILSNPNKFGFYYDSEDLYTSPIYKNITVDSSITDLVNFAKSQGVTYKELKMLNPWLRDKTLPNDVNKSYQIKILTSN